MNPPLPGIAALFSSLDASITVSPMIVLGIAGVFAVLGVVFVFLFEYHWKAYAVDKVEILKVRFWYYAGTVVFGGAMVLSALAYSAAS
jgi:hypothetical protein